MSLFAHIPAHTLTQVWSSLSRNSCPLGPTHIPALDHPSCQRGDVIEIHGPAASGKSHLLYYMLINCILPPELAGWGKVAVLLDTDHKFNMTRFVQLLRSRVGHHPDIDTIVDKASSLLHVFRPSSSHQLAATIQHLPVYLATELPEEDLGILAVDSISAFYWPDRYVHEQLRSSGSTKPPLRPANPLSHALTSITSFIQSHGPLVLLSSWDLNPASTSQWRQQPETLAPLPHTDVGQHMQHQLPVACRINLYHPSVEHPCDTDSENMVSKTSTISSLTAIVRSPGSLAAKRFTLQITESDILIS